MGSGGTFKEDKIPFSTVVSSLAAIANLRDSADRAEQYLIQVTQSPSDPAVWKALMTETDRMKTRGMLSVSMLRQLFRSQQEG